MKRVLALVALFVCLLPSILFGQAFTNTPNVGFEIPAFGSNDWNIPLVYNFNLLDTLLKNGTGTGGGITWQGAWTNTTAYVTNNAVSYFGSSYVAIANSTGQLPTNTAYWSPLALQGTTGPSSTIAVGTVSTGSTASVTNVGTNTAAIFNFVFPNASQTYPSAGIAVSSGTAWGTSLTAPTSAIVGVSDTQTLTNKSISYSQITGGPSSPFSATPGIVYNTTALVSRNATAGDFPILNQNTTGNAATATFATTAGSASTATSATTAGNITGVAAVANGGTGAATASANTVFGNFTGGVAAPGFSAAPVFSAANLTNFPTLNQNTTGNAATATLAAGVSGTVAIVNGGTGANSAAAAQTALGIQTVANGGTGSATAPANSIFGNFTGSTAAPGYSAAPVFSAANLTGFPTFNQSTTGSAASLSAASALPNGTTATTQTGGDNTTKVATDAFVAAAVAAGGGFTYPPAGIPLSTGTGWSTSFTAPASALVGISDTQTLSNKSISAGQINSGQLTVAQGGTGAATAAANTVFGNFTSGTAAPGFTAAPTFSAANLTNFPTFNQNTTGNAATATTATTAGTISGIVAIANGGTGAATAPANSVFGNFGGSTAAPGYSSTPVFSAATLTNFPTLNQNTTGSAASITGCVAVITPGSICYWNGVTWTLFAGNTSGNNILSENSSGVPSWVANSGGTSVATANLVFSPITVVTGKVVLLNKLIVLD